MKLSSVRLFLVAFLWGSSGAALAQATQAQPAPQAPFTANPFTFPIKPGTQNFLSGSMGEIRPNHFHGGIDIKTEGKIGLPVYAAGDGYISRVKISSYGYGNLVYVTHPNGLVTTYAHLHHFAPSLADHLLALQYQKKAFDVEAHFHEAQFPVQKGDIIAYSGNTGGSGGPHLHFEVRDSKDNLLNPLRYGFAEIVDQVPPTIYNFALTPQSIDARVNGEFTRREFTPVKQGATYTIADTLSAAGLLGLEIQAIDQYNGAANTNGVQAMELRINGETIYRHNIDGVPFDKQRQISVHINFPVLKLKNRAFQRLYVADGNTLPIYEIDHNRGRFRVQEGQVYEVVADLSDSYKNVSQLRFYIKGESSAYKALGAPKVTKPKIGHEVMESFLKITVADTAQKARNLDLYIGNYKYAVIPSYTTNAGSVYLYNLIGGLPDSAEVTGTRVRFPFNHLVPPGTEFLFSNRFMDITFRENSLYDTLILQTDRNAQDVFSINNPLTTLFQPAKVTIRPAKVPLDKSKAAVYALGWGKGAGFLGGTWDGDAITFSARDLGKFKVLSDTVAPTIKLASKSANQISFRIWDNLSGIASWSCEVNGQWLLLKWEHKTSTLTSEKLDKTVPLAGEVVLRVKDAMGNEAVYTTRI
ncbi:M23 family metallopeptidase [Rufibacter sp. XAAS-G3-1]|uniref:M23 family metallopeptidase n=1 Tax=Rufibacter sp. XAAS-G3-1 TaxID=2729134 RepID=UPI0021064E65|nr:M23 family metallopeptidase [Rufibacter sp. XAAS-G3-1]